LIPWRLEVFDQLGSTSDLCTARAKTGEAEGLAVLALKQTAGRGSRGRSWQAPEGNLNLSVLLRPARPAAQAGLFSLLTGIAAAEALEQFFAPPTMLKWPNDVLLDGAKLAGILLDAAPSGQTLDWLVIGIGMNLRHAPEIPGRATTSLAAHGVNISPHEAAGAVLSSLSRWHKAEPGAIQKNWLDRAHPIGTHLEIRGLHGTQAGTFAGLSPTGELLLRTKNRIEPISTGDVLLERA
jgi:BirA family transcriptional regulator, biotin operon repressor / biotin---[acetyl-CoA-carboxylase] ligase